VITSTRGVSSQGYETRSCLTEVVRSPCCCQNNSWPHRQDCGVSRDVLMLLFSTSRVNEGDIRNRYFSVFSRFLRRQAAKRADDVITASFHPKQCNDQQPTNEC